MDGVSETSWRASQENDSDSNQNSFVISNSEDESVSMEYWNPDCPCTSYKRTSNEPLKGRITPMIQKAIRLSIEKFSQELPDEEDEESQNKKKVERSDDDSDVSEEIEEARPLVIESDESKKTIVDSADNPRQTSTLEYHIPEKRRRFDVDSIAPRKGFLIIERDKLKEKIDMTRALWTCQDLEALSDKGARFLERRTNNEKELKRVEDELTELCSQEQARFEQPKLNEVETQMLNEGNCEIDKKYLEPTADSANKDRGKKAQETYKREECLTLSRLKDLHNSLVLRPADNQKIKDPQGLKIRLMDHQKYALAWLLWREKQKPRGGLLADDMGLGKTLTMISLVLASIGRRDADEMSSDDAEKWLGSGRFQRILGGTLVIAPASVFSQWESEVKNRCKRNVLMVELYHGKHREENLKRLAKNHIVITTYDTVSRCHKDKGTLYKICWRRVILDEGHMIKNHKSQRCEAVCAIQAEKRWVLTGTPIQNKQMDLFAILKFLRCSPFDNVRIWKRWVDNKDDFGQKRLTTLMKSIMLRRTKQELQAKGGLESLPNKSIKIINFVLDHEERLIYDKLMLYSTNIFYKFLAQRAEKPHKFELGWHQGKSYQSSGQSSGEISQFRKDKKKLFSVHADVGSHDILVLLLRLRQVCCHPSLIHAMVDKDDIEEAGLENSDNPVKLLSRLNDLPLLNVNEPEGETNFDQRLSENFLTFDNPVFDKKRQSSKMRAVLEKIKEIATMTKDKIIVVSQWTSMLDILAVELRAVKEVAHKMFTGKVAVKNRQRIMDDFNRPSSKTNVLLLSLTAGGVGLNLVGANHMLLIDIHWNPQLECQAEDRIYRFGQKKNVYIYRYVCTDTIEERIKALQDKKLEIAADILGGGGKTISSKLTFDDMKSLFGL